MGIDIISWRLRIGVFSPKTATSHCTPTLRNCAKHYAPSTKLSWVMIFLTVIFCILSLDAICMDIESNPGPTTPSTPQFSSLFNTTKQIQLKLIRYQHHLKNYDFYTANNIIPKSLLPRCIPAFDTNNFWLYKQRRNICRLTACRHLILLTKECRRNIKHLQNELIFYKNRLAEHCNSVTFSFYSTRIDSMALSLESLLADRRAHKNHLANQTSRSNNNTPTPSPTAPTQAGKTRNRRKHKPRKTHKTTNLDTTSVINLSQTPLSNDKLLVLARSLTFCPTPKCINLAELSADINDFTQRMRLKEYFHYHNNSTQPYEHNPFHNKSSWTPPTDRDAINMTSLQLIVITSQTT